MLYASADVAGHRWAPDLDLLLIDQERPVIATLTGAGLRVSEAVALDWSDVNLATGTLRVGKAKTDAGFYREIDLPGGLVDELAEWKMRGADELATWTARNPDGGDPVFLSAHAGRIRRQSAANVARRLKTAIKSANKRLGELGIEPISDRVTPHSLRRTYASLRAASGDDPVYIAEQLGRTDPRFMLTVYAKAVKRRAKLSGEYSAEYERALAGAANDRKGRKWQKAEVDQQQVGLRGNPLTWLSRATYSILIVRGALAEWSPPHPVPTGHPSRPPRRSTWEPRRRTGWKKARRRAAQGALRGTPSTATGSAVPDVDSRLVERIDRLDGAFELTLQDGDVISARRVVIAAGLEPFAWRPPPLGELPPDLVSHSSDHADLGRLSGKRVMVIGAGQSALESAALLHESGADVEIVARAPGVVWLADEHHARIRAHMWRVLLPPTDVGGRVTGWMAAAPELLRRMPGGLRPAVTRRCIVPAGSAWLRSRLAHVPLVLDRAVVEAAPAGTGVRVVLDDGAVRKPDRVLLGTGFRLDVAKYRFLPPELLGDLDLLDGYPRLGPGLESSIPGLHFAGASATLSFGPLMRFAVGTWHAAPAVARSALGRRQRDPAVVQAACLHSEASPKMQATGTGTVPGVSCCSVLPDSDRG